MGNQPGSVARNHLSSLIRLHTLSRLSAEHHVGLQHHWQSYPMRPKTPAPCVYLFCASGQGCSRVTCECPLWHGLRWVPSLCYVLSISEELGHGRFFRETHPLILEPGSAAIVLTMCRSYCLRSAGVAFRQLTIRMRMPRLISYHTHSLCANTPEVSDTLS